MTSSDICRTPPHSVSYSKTKLTASISKTQKISTGISVAFLSVIYQSLYRAVPSNGDLFLALPIAKEEAHPGLYSSYDLLISSGTRGPYHLYKYLGGYLFNIGANVDVIWEAFFLAFLFLTFLAFWYLFLELSEDQISSTLAVAIIAVAHPLRGSLHAAAVPISSFVTASAAMPFALIAIILLLRRQFLASMVLSGLVFNIHPYVGLLTASAVASGVLFGSGVSTRKKSLTIVVGVVVSLPNAIYILTHLPSNFANVDFDFFAQFRLYAMHAFVEDHWREGYGWFFVNLAGAVWFSRYFDKQKLRFIWISFGCWFAMMAVYVFNVYVTRNTAILLMFLFRATYFIKPILFIFVIHGIRLWRLELRGSAVDRPWWKPWEMSVAVITLFVSAILPMKFAVVADTVALTAYGFLLCLLAKEEDSHRLFSRGILLTGVAALCVICGEFLSGSSSIRALVENIVVGITVALGLTMLAVFMRLNKKSRTTALVERRSSSTPALIGLATLVFLFHHLLISLNDRTVPFVPDTRGIENRIFMQRPPLKSAGLEIWARTSTPVGSLFVIPPDNSDDFGNFRLVAERGIYVTVMEVNQLAFDASVYHLAHQRLIGLGIKFLGRRDFDSQGYYQLQRIDLTRLEEQEHVDYFVAEKDRLGPSLSSLPTVYSDEHYVAIDLHNIAGLQRLSLERTTPPIHSSKK